MPIVPLTGIFPSHSQRHGSRPRTAGRNTSASTVPIQRNHAEPPERERIHVQPSPPSHNGRKNAVIPRTCSRRSLRYAPKRPIQLCTAWGPVAPEAVFSDGSVGWYVPSARNMRSAPNTSTSPSKIFQGRLRVGAKTMRMGFMARALRLDGRAGKLPRACLSRTGEESQSNLYYPRRRSQFLAKEAGRNLAVDPRQTKDLVISPIEELVAPASWPAVAWASRPTLTPHR